MWIKREDAIKYLKAYVQGAPAPLSMKALQEDVDAARKALGDYIYNLDLTTTKVVEPQSRRLRASRSVNGNHLIDVMHELSEEDSAKVHELQEAVNTACNAKEYARMEYRERPLQRVSTEEAEAYIAMLEEKTSASVNVPKNMAVAAELGKTFLESTSQGGEEK